MKEPLPGFIKFIKKSPPLQMNVYRGGSLLQRWRLLFFSNILKKKVN